MQAHNFHWNVEGPRLRSLHKMLEEQNRDLWNALDDIAERIRALGADAPGTYAKFKARGSIADNAQIPKADAMLDELVADNETVVRNRRAAVAVAEAQDDPATAELLTERLHPHEKQLWMMRRMRA